MSQIKLTEQDLHMLVEDAVNSYLMNEGITEDWWGGVKNAWQGAFGKNKQGQRNWNFNFGQTYRAGNWASSFNSYTQEAQSALGQMITIAKETKNAQIAKELGRISKELGKAAAGFTKMATAAQTSSNLNTQVNNPWANKTPKTAPVTPTATKTPMTGSVPKPGTVVPGSATATPGRTATG